MLSTDRDLSRLVNKNSQGLIYVWSPGMPLSVRGISEIRRVANDLNLPLKIVVDPIIESERIEKEVKDSRLDLSTTDRVESFELFLSWNHSSLPKFSSL